MASCRECIHSGFCYLTIKTDGQCCEFVNRNNLVKWIPVTERLPEVDADVLMYFAPDKNMTAGFLVDVDEHLTFWCAYSDGGYYTDCDYMPTHWMPLPEPPKED